MKKYVILTVICFGLYQMNFAQTNIQWKDFEEAFNANAQSKAPKKLFVDVYTDWCGWCKRMDANTFSNPQVAKIMNKYYVNVKLNAEMTDTVRLGNQMFVNTGVGQSRSSHQLAQALLQGRMSYPSFVIIDEQGKVINVAPGYMTPQNIEPILEYFGSDAYKTTTWEDFQKTFVGTIKE